MWLQMFSLISRYNIDIIWTVENIVIWILAHIAHPYSSPKNENFGLILFEMTSQQVSIRFHFK